MTSKCKWCKAEPVKSSLVTERDDRMDVDKKCTVCGKEWYETYKLESWDLIVSE
jgi:hypothetical protein